MAPRVLIVEAVSSVALIVLLTVLRFRFFVSVRGLTGDTRRGFISLIRVLITYDLFAFAT